MTIVARVRSVKPNGVEHLCSPQVFDDRSGVFVDSKDESIVAVRVSGAKYTTNGDLVILHQTMNGTWVFQTR